MTTTTLAPRSTSDPTFRNEQTNRLPQHTGTTGTPSAGPLNQADDYNVWPAGALAHGAHPILAPSVVPVFWGTGQGLQTANLDVFYQDIVGSYYLDTFSEYGTSHGSTVTPIVVTPHQSPGTIVSFSGITSELTYQAGIGRIPHSTSSLYMVHMSPSVSWTDGNNPPSIVSCNYPSPPASATVECGHNFYDPGTGFQWAVIADMSASGCSSGCGGNPPNLAVPQNSAAVNATTWTATHELLEKASDTQIADRCADDAQAIVLTHGAWAVNPGWSNTVGGCIIQKTNLFPGGGVAATSRSSNIVDIWTIGEDHTLNRPGFSRDSET